MTFRAANARAAAAQVASRQAALKAQQLRAEVVQTLSQPGRGETRQSTHRYDKKTDSLVRRKRTKAHTASAPGDAPAVDTGRLRQSIGVQKIGEGHYRVGTNVEYALYLEWGTRKMAARPFMRPALEKVKNSA